MKVTKKNDQALTKLIPHLYQSFPIWEYAEHEDLREDICDLFDEIDAVVEEGVKLAGIRDAEPGEDLYAYHDTPNSSVERHHLINIKIGGSPEDARDPPFCIF